MPQPKVNIADADGNIVDVDTSSNALHVKLVESIDLGTIGDVSLLLDGTAADYGTGNVNTSGRTLRVTLASNDAQFGELADSAGIDGTIHGKLRYIAQNSLDSPQYGSGANGHQRMGDTASVISTGKVMLAERNDTLAIASGVTTGEWSNLQVNALGALYTTGGEVENAAVQSEPLLIGGRYDETARTLGNGDAGAVALNVAGQLQVTSTGTTIASYAQDTIGTSAVALNAGNPATLTDCKEIIIQCDFDNTGYIMVGDGSLVADTDGIRLEAGDTLTLAATTTANIYLRGSASDQKVNTMTIR